VLAAPFFGVAAFHRATIRRFRSAFSARSAPASDKRQFMKAKFIEADFLSAPDLLYVKDDGAKPS
jgi:hypothetical protein